MRQVKHDRIAEVLHRKAAEFARDNATNSSLLTITRVELSPTGKEVKIFFTTLPDSEQNAALKFLERKTPQFKQFLKEETRLGIIPHIDFKIDFGERNRQRLDELSGN